MALTLAGLPSDRFLFAGFLPSKDKARSEVLEELATVPATLVFFEAPHRLDDTLAAMAVAFGGDRPAAVCRELTKTYEEIVRGPLADLVAWASAGQVRGEIVVVVGGAVKAVELSTADLVAEVLSRTGAGDRLKDAVAEVAAAAGVPKRDLYAAALAARPR